MLDSAGFLWLLALVLGLIVARRDVALLKRALRSAIDNLIAIMPRIGLALLLAGFVAKLIPTEMVGHMIGPETGWAGIAIATLFGGMMPSGPMIAFPVVVVLRNADAGIPQVVAFLTAWSVFAWHRVLIYEVAMLGWHFVMVRMVSSLTLPFVAGGIATLLSRMTGMR
jgi:uncharacterized membrane protein YraQ (UPF0718 family)